MSQNLSSYFSEELSFEKLIIIIKYCILRALMSKEMFNIDEVCVIDIEKDRIYVFDPNKPSFYTPRRSDDFIKITKNFLCTLMEIECLRRRI